MTGPGLARVAGEAAPVLERLTRLGFLAKGVVTVLVGALALQYALGRGGDLTGPGGAIRAIRDQPFGRVSMLMLIAGLAGYALWMFVAAFVDPERKGTGLAGIAERVGFFFTGIGYALLAYGALALLLGGGGGGASLDDLAAALLTPRVGRWLVGLVGAIVMTAGLLQIRLGLTAGFRDSFRSELPRLERGAAVVAGVLGYMALGVLSLLVGYSLVRVAVEYDPSAARGWDEALGLLSRLGEGRWALGAAAAGLVLYGLYFVLLVRIRRL
ncbi:MAG TPA: DUF1206 domain-containing protein [Gemmatimonadales bacterium]|jgi:hypothetical protein|nr:DUF1206 domain-containing protein [Gemmatimonadales bacterium]